MISRWLVVGLGAGLLLGGLASPAAAGTGDVLVRFEPGAGAAERSEARSDAGTDFERTLPLRGLQLVDPESGVSVGEAVERLERSPDVLYAEPDQVRSIEATIPNDARFNLEWGLHNTGQSIEGQTGFADADIDAPEAWDLTTGSAGVTVAVADSGIDAAHPDLSPNLWSNPGETPTGGDDDGNGFVNDTRGWDFVQDDNNPQDAHGHGTHVSGTIGAQGNDGVGVTGVAWDTALMPLRVLNANGSGTVSDLIDAYEYASAEGAKVFNASLGGAGGSQAEEDAIAAASGVLFVFAAGNDNPGQDNDSFPTYPCSYDLPNIICVAATDNRDALADFSNYGPATVDLGAPGVSVQSTLPGNTYDFFDGTSMATPHVTGAAALELSRSPSSSVAAVRSALLNSVDPNPSLAGNTVTGGRLNVNSALRGTITSSSSGSAATVLPSSGAAPPVGSTPARRGSSTGVDRSAPAIAVRLVSGLRLGTALRRGIRARVRCSEACTLLAELLIDRSAARRLGLLSARRVVLGRGRRAIGRAGTATVTVRLSRTARRRLRGRRSVRLALRVRARDRSGNARVLTRRLTLRR